MHAGAQHSRCPDLKYLIDVKTGPNSLNFLDRALPAPGARCDHGGGHRTGGGSNDHPEGVRAVFQQLRHAFEHAHLVSGARATTGQHQTGNRTTW